MFFYFLKKNIKTYNTNYEKNKKIMAINPSKNLLIIIDRFSELDLELENLSKIENENMKVTEKKMEYLYKVEKDGDINFYKDICPVSKPKKVSIEDELRIFKNL